MMNEFDSFNKQMTAGTKNVLDSSKFLFQAQKQSNQPSPAIQFALATEHLIDTAPNYTPHIEDTIDASTDKVRQFIKAASRHFGQISINLESI